MKRIVYCNLVLYELHQKIYLADLDKKEEGQVVCLTTTENLSKEILYICNKYQVSNVYLFGNETYLSKIAEEIRSNDQTEYIKSINVEVNNKCLNI